MPTLPISMALREAQPESISDLYSRDVEPMSDADIDRIIEEQRAQRERAEQAEVLGRRSPREPRPLNIRTAPRPDYSGTGVPPI